MRNLARCYLAQGKVKKAVAKAQETIKRCGEKQVIEYYANMAGLVLAEAYIEQGRVDECEESLGAIEESDPSADFFVLGNIQRIRGLAAIASEDTELAIHHFSRTFSLSLKPRKIFITPV